MGEFDFALLVGIDLVESMLIRFWIRQALWYSGVSAPVHEKTAIKSIHALLISFSHGQPGLYLLSVLPVACEGGLG